MSITITHSLPDGTLVDGTARGDGSAPILKAQRFRWSRNLGQWFMPQSRDRIAQRHRIEELERALTAGGFEVTVEIDNEVASPVEREERRADRADARAEGLAAKSERLGAEANAAYARTRQISDMIPMGQPILVGHHSERRHRRDIERIDNGMRQTVELSRESEAAARASHVATREQQRRRDPAFVGNRIKDREAEERGYLRSLARYADVDLSTLEERSRQWVEDTQARLAQCREDLAYWRGLWAELEAAGAAKTWTKADFKKGDLVKIRGRWEIVARANPKTIAVETGYSWASKHAYHEVQDRRDAPGEASVCGGTGNHDGQPISGCDECGADAA